MFLSFLHTVGFMQETDNFLASKRGRRQRFTKQRCSKESMCHLLKQTDTNSVKDRQCRSDPCVSACSCWGHTCKKNVTCLNCCTEVLMQSALQLLSQEPYKYYHIAPNKVKTQSNNVLEFRRVLKFLLFISVIVEFSVYLTIRTPISKNMSP